MTMAQMRQQIENEMFSPAKTSECGACPLAGCKGAANPGEGSVPTCARAGLTPGAGGGKGLKSVQANFVR